MENLTKSGYGSSSIGRLLQTLSPPHQLHCLTEELWLCCNSCATMRSERMWLDHQWSKVMAFFLRNLKLEDLWTGSRDPLWLRKWREHQTWPSYSVILNSLYFFNFEKPTGFRQSAEKGTFLCSQFERWPLKSTGVHNRRCTNSFRLPQKTPPCCNVRSSLAMQSSVPVKRLGIGRWPGKF